jgi:transposase
VAVSQRTLQRAVQPYRQALKAEALATTRFETPPGRQLQIDFGERLVEICDAKIKAFVFVGTLGHSRRLHVRAFRGERRTSSTRPRRELSRRRRHRLLCANALAY